MTKSFGRNVCLLAGAFALSVSLTTTADVLFDNTVNDANQRFNPGTSEVGDQIVLSSTQPGPLSSFSFEYFGTSTQSGQTLFAGNVEGRVRFYSMDGTPFNGYASPGTAFYDSGWFSVPAPTERSTMNFTAGVDFPPTGLFIPVGEMTWSIQFRGLGSGDVVGLDIFTPPVVGQDYPDYWVKEGNNWVLKQDAFPIDFAARFEANIPEPSSITLLLFGGLGMFLMRRNRH